MEVNFIEIKADNTGIAIATASISNTDIGKVFS